MKCIINYVFLSEDDADPQYASDLVTVDEDRICLSGDDRPIDLLIENISRLTFLSDVRQVARALDQLGEAGCSSIRMAVFPQAVQRMRLVPHFRPKADHCIQIRMKPNTFNGFDAWLSLDGCEEYELGMREIIRAPENNGDSSMPLFHQSKGHGRAPDPLRIDQIASGAVLTGICDALFETDMRVPREIFTRERAILVGILTAMSGHDFTAFGTKSCVEWAVPACASQFDSFRSNGYILSEKCWNPRFIQPGPRLQEARREADPVIRATAARLWSEITCFDASFAQGVAYALVDANNVRRAQISSYLGNEPASSQSNHWIAQTAGHARRLTEICRRDAA